MNEEGILEKSKFDFSKTTERIQLLLILIGAFAVPIWLASFFKTVFGGTSWIATNSQLIVGSLVNTALITAAINIKGWKKIVGIVTLPSIATILSGYVFKSASVFMVYMIPAIWAGNFALVYLYKLLLVAKEKNYVLSAVVSIIVKVAIIFAGFSILRVFGIFPEKIVATLQTAMGTTQAITATIGSVISFGILKLCENK